MLQKNITDPGLIMRMVAPFAAAKPKFKTMADEADAIATAARIYKFGDARELNHRKWDADVEASWLKMRRSEIKTDIHWAEDMLYGNPVVSPAKSAAYSQLSIIAEDGEVISGEDVLAYLEKRDVADGMARPTVGEDDAEAASERLMSLYEELAEVDARLTNLATDDSYRQKLGWIGWALANIDRIKLKAESIEGDEVNR